MIYSKIFIFYKFYILTFTLDFFYSTIFMSWHFYMVWGKDPNLFFSVDIHLLKGFFSTCSIVTQSQLIIDSRVYI